VAIKPLRKYYLCIPCKFASLFSRPNTIRSGLNDGAKKV
jgi:hypothetical protein